MKGYLERSPGLPLWEGLSEALGTTDLAHLQDSPGDGAGLCVGVIRTFQTWVMALHSTASTCPGNMSAASGSIGEKGHREGQPKSRQGDDSAEVTPEAEAVHPSVWLCHLPSMPDGLLGPSQQGSWP